MIRIVFLNCGWGVDPLSAVSDQPGGAQINMQDAKSDIWAHLPFTGNSLPELIAKLSACLTDEQKGELAPLFRGGLATATPEDLKRMLGQQPGPGAPPQG